MGDSVRNITIPAKPEGLPEGIPQRRSIGLMVGMAAGHGIKHFYQQGVILLLPYIKASLGIGDVEVGFIGTVRTISSATMNMTNTAKKYFISLIIPPFH